MLARYNLRGQEALDDSGAFFFVAVAAFCCGNVREMRQRMSGKRDQALAILDKVKTTNEPTDLAILYAGLGDKEEAFAALERAYAAHDPQMQYLKVEPHYDSLRSDPRFIALMRKVGLPL